nr:reverse transcriptase domain-containing protein [Microbulbifer rhizosphaerae]
MSNASGIDNLTQKQFWPRLNDEVSVISRKVLAGSYRFSKYKLRLISKGRGKVPREISIPTIRDRIALRALCDFLVERHDGVIKFELPQNMVKAAKEEIQSGKYTGFIKLDVSNFYPSISHQELLRRLRKRVRHPEIIEFVQSAVATPTVSRSRATDVKGTSGVPQGLSISNILAAIYLINVDRCFSNFADIAYHRYIDDIFILCDYKDVYSIAREIVRRFRRIGLTIHDPVKAPEKSTMGKVGEKFDYLGYQFKGRQISPREASIEKLKESLVSIFTGYKHSKVKSQEFLLWRLNLRITGCIFQKKAKGWMFFFSEINDETILHNLDRYVSKLLERFGVTVSPKRFVRAFYEIRHSKYQTNYIPNFDTYSIPQMAEVLELYFAKSTAGLAEEEVVYEFRKRIDRQVRDLLTDVQDFGY